MAKVYEDDMFPICPSDDFVCPYYNKGNGRCMMFKKENVLPYNECDNFWDDDYEDGADEVGYNPYTGAYDFDC